MSSKMMKKKCEGGVALFWKIHHVCMQGKFGMHAIYGSLSFWGLPASWCGKEEGEDEMVK